MTIRTKQVTDRSTWDAALASLPEPHVLQTWDWGDFKCRWGWQPTRLLLEREGRPIATAQILQRQLRRTPFSVIYVPKGPVLDYDDTQLLAKVLATLEQQTDRKRTLFSKIDPDVWRGYGTDLSAPLPRAKAVLETLAKRGWRQSAEQIQFKNTHILDLRADEDTLMANMKAKTRYNVRLSTRRGVYTRLGSEESDLRTFYQLYYETSQRNGFLIRPPAYYLDIWTQTLRAGRSHLLLAEVDGDPIAGLMMFRFRQTAWYMYGASSNQHRNLMPNFLLQWEAMRLAKRHGCTKYDMWGAPDRFDESDPLWGVFRFKTGFGGETMQGLGAFDYAPSPWLYWIYTAVMPRALALMRRRHRPEL
jgi:lipid II:glycine glycyltransferase (peptidoglycan interpeptide bridge formation enzyme)